MCHEFTANEIETVLAHEVGHYVNKDIPLMIATETVTIVVGLWLASQSLRWGTDIAALPLFMLVIGAFGLLTMPLNNVF